MSFFIGNLSSFSEIPKPTEISEEIAGTESSRSFQSVPTRFTESDGLSSFAENIIELEKAVVEEGVEEHPLTLSPIPNGEKVTYFAASLVIPTTKLLLYRDVMPGVDDNEDEDSGEESDEERSLFVALVIFKVLHYRSAYCK